MTDLLISILWFFGDALVQLIIELIVHVLFPFARRDDGGNCGCAIIFILLCLFVGVILWLVFAG
jgi:heme/copper-type cytochrome/quinol oxidase subunit 4